MENIEIQFNEEALDKPRVIRAMELLYAQELFNTPKKSKEFFDALSFDDFKKFLGFVNGLERELHGKARPEVGSNSLVNSSGFMTGESVEYRPPAGKYRERLLELAHAKSHQIEDPAAAGLTLAFAINAIHPFDDGNGRTARVVYGLLGHGFDGSDEDINLFCKLSENTKGREIINPNPSEHGVDKELISEMKDVVEKKFGHGSSPDRLCGGYGDAFVGEYSVDSLNVSDEISEIDRKMLNSCMQDGDFTIVSLLCAFSQERISEFIERRPPEFEKAIGKYSWIDGNNFVKSLSSEEIHKFYQKSLMVKNSYVKKLINFYNLAIGEDIVRKYSMKLDQI